MKIGSLFSDDEFANREAETLRDEPTTPHPGVSEDVIRHLYQAALEGGAQGGIEIARTIVNAIAPRLKAEGLRETADEWRKTFKCDTAAEDFMRKRADALSPPVKETKCEDRSAFDTLPDDYETGDY